MKHIFSLAFLLVIAQLCLCQVTRVEYFIDTDPGFGNGVSVSITTGNDISQNFTVPLTSISVGYHTLYIRSKDAQGYWSLTARHTFFILQTSGTTVTSAEYFIDTDPGTGKGTAITVTNAANTTASFVVPLANQKFGFHTLFLRVRDNQNQWSLTQQKVFYLDQSSDTTKITSFQYYFTDTSGLQSSIYTYAVPSPAAAVDLKFTANLSGLVPEKAYTMFIWAVTNDGKKSLVQTKKVDVCSGNIAKAGFDAIIDGTKVNFLDSSLGSGRYNWNFGDNKTDTIASPLHLYNTAGNYTARQIVSNFCNTDTLIKTIAVRGIRGIAPDKGGNTGPVTLDIKGAGFAAGTKVYMRKTGEVNLTCDTPVIRNDGLMTAAFNLKNKKKGLWDVVVVFPDGKQDTLAAAFTMEDGNEPKLSVSISGSYVLRIGFNQIYNINYSNKGNTDASLVPLYIGGLPLGTDIEVLDPLFDVNTVPGIGALNLPSFHISHTINDSASGTSFRNLLLNKIPANGSGSIQVIFHVPDTTRLHILPEIKVCTGPPLIDPSDLPESPNGQADTAGLSHNVAACMESLTSVAVQQALEKITKRPFKDFGGVTGCFNGLITQRVVSKFFHSPEKAMDNTDLSLAVITTGFDCSRTVALAVLGVSGAFGQLEVAVPAAYIHQRLTAAENLFKVLSIAADVKTISDNCKALLKYKASDILQVIIGNAWDPNSKWGPGDMSDKHYTTGKTMNYVIGFENDPAANLNVQTITVTDTLKQSFYNLQTFGFTSVTVGDSVYSLRTPEKSFFHDFDFTARFGVKARVSAIFNPGTGIAQWRINSIDPATNQITSKALDGFLPPDKLSPNGQGYVSFMVDPVDGTKNADTVSNKAYIKFDYNPIIITNTWGNTFDLVKPVSAVKNLPAQTPDTAFAVSWDGTDNRSGISSFAVYYCINGGPFSLWLNDIHEKTAVFTGAMRDSTYKFYSISTDNAGNIENAKTTAETSTLVGAKVTAINGPLSNGFYFRQNYPNPVQNSTWVEFGLSLPQNVQMVLRDIQGKEISIVANKLFAQGMQKLNVNLSNLAAGLYILEFNSKSFRKSIKLVKQ